MICYLHVDLMRWLVRSRRSALLLSPIDSSVTPFTRLCQVRP